MGPYLLIKYIFVSCAYKLCIKRENEDWKGIINAYLQEGELWVTFFFMLTYTSHIFYNEKACPVTFSKVKFIKQRQNIPMIVKHAYLPL